MRVPFAAPPLRRLARIAALAFAGAALAGCQPGPGAGREPAAATADTLDLAGAWRSQVQFASGPFAAIEDLEFMYAFNAGGTMTESSNYDAMPPVPPAYGLWRKIGPRRYEARYEFYATQAPARLEAITRGGGWSPAGRGVLNESIELSADGNAFTSTLRYAAFDRTGQPTAGGGEAVGKGVRMGFSPEPTAPAR